MITKNENPSIENLTYEQAHLRNFLLERPAINISQIETICKIPTDTIRHFVKDRRNIPAKYFETIVSELGNYGFVNLCAE